MPGKRARPVRREAARKRPGFIQDEHGTSLGSPPYPGCSPRWSPRSGRPGSISTCTCRTGGRRTRGAGSKARHPGGPGVRHQAGTGHRAGKRLVAAGLRVLWAAADEVYGRCGEFRDACPALGLAYVVIIPCDYRVTLAKNKVIRADEALSEAVFERRSCGNGTKGPRYGDWALIAAADPREFLLIRRLPDREKNQYTFYLCWAPEGRPATMTYFITIAGRRWPVEITFKTGKDALGWDKSQARTWDAICRHTALTALAQLRTAAIRAALTGTAAAPATGPDTAAAGQHTARSTDADAEPPLTCSSTGTTRRCPSAAASPARPASPRSSCPPPRPPASSASPATGKPGSSPPPASPSISAGQHGADATRPAPAGTTTPPASRPSPPDPPRPKGGDST